MSNTTLLKQILDELREMKFWLRISGLPSLRRILLENLRDDVDKLVYELSDGIRSTREIASILNEIGKGISHATVANLWKRWAITGLVEPSKKYKGRYEKVFQQESLGIEIPNIPKRGEEDD